MNTKSHEYKKRITTMSKNTILFLSVFFLANTAFSQEQNYIEVIVSDTISLKAISFIYEISEQESYDEYDEYEMYDENGEIIEKKGNNQDKVIKNTLEDIKAILKKEKIAFKEDNFAQYTPSNPFTKLTKENASKKIILELKNELEIKHIQTLIEGKNGIKGSLSSINYESLEAYQSIIYERLYKKAMKKAGIIASQSGNTVGKTLNVSDIINPNLFDTNKIYKDLYKGMGIFNSSFELKKIEDIELRYKFELK